MSSSRSSTTVSESVEDYSSDDGLNLLSPAPVTSVTPITKHTRLQRLGQEVVQFSKAAAAGDLVMQGALSVLPAPWPQIIGGCYYVVPNMVDGAARALATQPAPFAKLPRAALANPVSTLSPLFLVGYPAAYAISKGVVLPAARLFVPTAGYVAFKGTKKILSVVTDKDGGIALGSEHFQPNVLQKGVQHFSEVAFSLSLTDATLATLKYFGATVTDPRAQMGILLADFALLKMAEHFSFKQHPIKSLAPQLVLRPLLLDEESDEENTLASITPPEPQTPSYSMQLFGVSKRALFVGGVMGTAYVISEATCFIAQMMTMNAPTNPHPSTPEPTVCEADTLPNRMTRMAIALGGAKLVEYVAADIIPSIANSCAGFFNRRRGYEHPSHGTAPALDVSNSSTPSQSP